MKAVILAAGKSTRMRPFTVDKPKQLLPILDKTLIQRSIESLKGVVDEAVIVVGYCKEQIINRLGNNYQNIKIKYVEQKEQKGTGHALLQAKPELKGKFLLLNGDDLYSNKDINSCVKHDLCVLAKKVNDPEKWGVFNVEKGILKGVEEKPQKPRSNLANTGCYVLDDRIFQYLQKIRPSQRGELEVTSALNEMCKEHKIFVEEVRDYWLPIGYPWHLLEANVFFLHKIAKSSIKGKIERNVTVKGVLVLGKGSIIKSGTYVEGPVWIGNDCEIGPSAYLRKDTILLDQVRTRAEIIDSLLMNGVTAKHDSYIGHSVVGENCNIGAGTITADYRHDGKNNMTLISGIKVDTGRRKLGAFIGDKVRTGIHTSIYPGRKIWPHKMTMPGEIVTKDIE